MAAGWSIELISRVYSQTNMFWFLQASSHLLDKKENGVTGRPWWKPQAETCCLNYEDPHLCPNLYWWLSATCWIWQIAKKKKILISVIVIISHFLQQKCSINICCTENTLSVFQRLGSWRLIYIKKMYCLEHNFYDFCHVANKYWINLHCKHCQLWL